MDIFNSKIMKRLRNEIDEIIKRTTSGELEGRWNIKQINDPKVKGYIVYGRFGSDEALEPFEPLKPWKRPPMPERPFGVPKTALKESREPLTDIFEEENEMKIYVELPGEEKANIQLNITESEIEIKAKRFYKRIELPQRSVNLEKASSKYKNGVLEITIPIQENSPKKDARKINIE